MTTLDTTQHNHALMTLGPRPSAAMLRAQGAYLWDERGKRYLDFVQGWAVNALGHNPRVLITALERQLEELIHAGAGFYNRPALELARELTLVTGLDRVWFGTSGADANEAAVKLARKWAQRYKPGAFEVITALDSFHGRTLAMTSASGKPGFERAFPPGVEGFPKVPYGDLEALSRTLSPHTAAVMLEPIQGEAGAVMPPVGYLTAVRELCDRAGVLLILDEIQTGLGRTGPLFAFECERARPDILTLGKGLGGGLPISAMLSLEAVACFAPGDHGGTFSGNALMCAGALAVLSELLDAKHAQQRQASAACLERELRGVAAVSGAQLRGRGHLWGLVLPEPRAVEVRDCAYALGLLVNAARPDVLRFMPALDVSEDEIHEMGRLLRLALR